MSLRNLLDADDVPTTSEMLDNEHSKVVFWWVTGGIGLLFNLVVTAAVFRIHLKIPSSIQRTRLLYIASVPTVIATCSYFSLYNLKVGALLDIFLTGYTGFSVYALFKFLWDLFGGWGGFAQELENSEPRKFFVVAPCGCFCRPFDEVQPFTEAKLIRVCVGMLQIIFFKPVLLSLALIILVAASDSYTPGSIKLDNAWFLIRIGLITTTMTSVYSMNILRQPLAVSSDHYNLDNKFRVCMVMVMMVTFQQVLFDMMVKIGILSGNDTINDDQISIIWNSYAMIFTATLIELRIWFYWSAKDYSVYNRYVEIEDRVTDPLITN